MNQIAGIKPDASSRRSPYFSEEHEMLRAQVRRFVESEIKPRALAWEEQGCVPREVLRRMGSLGFFGIRYPARYGGSEMDALATVVLAEELGRSTFSGVAITALVHSDMASIHVFRSGSEAQKDKWMPGIIAGEVITAVAVTEPDAGSDVKGIRAFARREGDSYVLNGAKMFITNGVHANLYCVAAKTEREGAPSRSITMFLVEKGTPGFTVSRTLDKHGWRSSDTAELHFDDCRIPAENLLGQEGRGFYAIMGNFQNERVTIGAMAMGEAQAALDLTLDYVRTRKAFGAPLWARETIRQRLARLAAKVEAGRQLVYHAAWLDTQGVDATREVSMVKAYCGELVNEVMYDCVQFHGGMGFMSESTIERMSRDARVQNIGGGATEVMLEEVAKRM
jgi:acyl-CoA dehydrogenase